MLVCSILVILLRLVSTRFPYTTLFRSAAWRSAGMAQASHGSGGARRCKNWRCRDTGTVGGQRRRVMDEREAMDRLRGADPDRKSTRLNSSHVAISYAVFCLKKKRNCND